MRDVTVRGRCFLAAGAAAIICGIQIGERDFVRIGLLAMLIPTLAWLVLRRTERKVWVRRNVSAIQVEAGETAEVEVEIGNAGRRTGTLLLEEELSPALGPPARFVVEPMPGGATTRRSYQIHTESRGRYPVGPMHVRVGDPLGMVDFDQAIPSTTSILVTPRTEPLPRIPLIGRWAGAGDNRTRDLLGGGSPDVTIREYRLGDDLRRIHWPTSARTGELMVRREEQQWQSRCTLLIDNRRIAHRGYGPKSSMERAVSVTASIMRNLVAQDFEVRLVSATGRSSSHGWHQGSAGGVNLPEQLERLALMTMTRHETALHRMDRGHRPRRDAARSVRPPQRLRSRTCCPAWRPRATRRTPWCWTSTRGTTRTTVPNRRRPPPCAAAAGRPPPWSGTAPWRPVDGAGPMTVEAPPGTRPTDHDLRGAGGVAPRPPLLALVTGWVAAFAWTGMVERPAHLLDPEPDGRDGDGRWPAAVRAVSTPTGGRVSPYVVAARAGTGRAARAQPDLRRARVLPRSGADRGLAAAALLRDRQRRRDPERLRGAGRGQPDPHPRVPDALRAGRAVRDRRARLRADAARRWSPSPCW